jgi:hypothetical protein
MLRLPTKKDEKDESLDKTVLAVIDRAYGELAPKACARDAAVLRRAREAASRAVNNSALETEAAAAAAVQALLLYFAVLERLQAALGAEIRDQKSPTFAWRGAFETNEKCAEPNAALELSSVAWNLAAALSSSGVSAPADDPKAAVRHFALAAGVLDAIASQLNPGAALDACSSDLCEGVLGAARALMLAQAQACFCEKAAGDNLGSGTQAKLCMGAAKLCAEPGLMTPH